MPTPQENYETEIALIGDQFRELLDAHAARMSTNVDTLLKAVVADMLGEDARADGRAREWRIRLLLYSYAHGLEEPEADTDPDLELGQPGTIIFRGLEAVRIYIAETASKHHDAACIGLDQNTLKRKERSLRTMMAYRQDGTGTLRADYQVHTAYGIRYMMARCDVIQVGKEVPVPARKIPGGLRVMQRPGMLAQTTARARTAF